jgi:PIN domain nuclease of toxin-antitoxin system
VRLLLDSHVLLAVLNRDTIRQGVAIAHLLETEDSELVVSVASLWEIAIKSRLGKLRLPIPLAEVPDYISFLDYAMLDINHQHAIETLAELPSTKDPFDRLLLAQCQVEGMRLVTTDRALQRHPLAWRPA